MRLACNNSSSNKKQPSPERLQFPLKRPWEALWMARRGPKSFHNSWHREEEKSMCPKELPGISHSERKQLVRITIPWDFQAQKRNASPPWELFSADWSFSPLLVSYLRTYTYFRWILLHMQLMFLQKIMHFAVWKQTNNKKKPFFWKLLIL